MKRSFKLLACTCAVFLLAWIIVLAVQIHDAGRATPSGKADVAVVLGAAVHGHAPSPVFAERIKHGISLYKSGKVDALLFTGGYGNGAKAAESVVARCYAVKHGVPPEAILIETKSRTTRANLVQARRQMRASNLRTAFIVSDPLHMKRALRMAADLEWTRNQRPPQPAVTDPGVRRRRSCFASCISTITTY